MYDTVEKKIGSMIKQNQLNNLSMRDMKGVGLQMVVFCIELRFGGSLRMYTTFKSDSWLSEVWE